MNIKKILLLLSCVIATCVSLTFLASCSEDNDVVKVTVVENPEWKTIVDLVGKFEYNSETDQWQFLQDRNYIARLLPEGTLPSGDEAGCVLTIVNWDESYKEYFEGCIVQGECRLMKMETHEVSENVSVYLYYYELKINDIDKYK